MQWTTPDFSGVTQSLDDMVVIVGAGELGPLGSSGSRITLTLLNRLETEGLQRGVATMCVGVGQGTAIAIERV